MSWKKVSPDNLPEYGVPVLAIDWRRRIIRTRRTIRWDWHWKGNKIFGPRFSYWDALPNLPHDLMKKAKHEKVPTAVPT